jgi:hypothetical protein
VNTQVFHYYCVYCSSLYLLFVLLVWDYIRAELQPSCPLVCLRGYGTIGTLPDLSETVELEIGRSYSVLLLPNMPGVSFHTFQLDENQVTKLQNSDVS